MEALDSAVLNGVKALLDPAAADYVVNKAQELVTANQQRAPQRLTILNRELRKTQKQLDNLLALAADGAPKSVLAEIGAREERIEELNTEIAGLAVADPDELAAPRLKKRLREYLNRFEDLMQYETPRAREALRKLFGEPLTVRPVKKNGRRTLEVQGSVEFYLKVASPRGFEPLLPA